MYAPRRFCGYWGRMSASTDTPDIAPDEVELCTRQDLARKGRINLWIEGWRDEVVAFERAPHPLVISGLCPHFGGELDLLPSTNTLHCRWHGWEFDATSGQCRTYPIKGCIRYFKSEWRADVLVVFRNADP
jgi:nitrite reductase/ring-hydroxylating ferredoxin subunit